MAKIKVLNTDITIVKQNIEDYISLTDMANLKIQLMQMKSYEIG